MRCAGDVFAHSLASTDTFRRFCAETDRTLHILVPEPAVQRNSTENYLGDYVRQRPQCYIPSSLAPDPIRGRSGALLHASQL